MARSLDSALETELDASLWRPRFFVECNFDSGDLLVWSGLGDKTTMSKTFKGVGKLLSVGQVEETTSMKAADTVLALDGLSTAEVSIALQEDWQNRPCKIYLGAVDADDNLVADPQLRLTGFIDAMDIDEAPDTARIAVRVENIIAALERPNKQLYTGERQKIDFSGDLGFDQVPSLQESEVIFGR